LLLDFSNFTLDSDRRELRGHEGAIHVEPQVFDLLLYFAKNANRVISKDELIEHVWKGRIVSDAALNSRINSARRAIGESGEHQILIRTVQRRGFLFAAEVKSKTNDEIAYTASAGAPIEPPKLALPEKPSIAVLPFQNLSGDPEQEYFADGVVEDIITGLSRIKSLFVIARNSTFAYKGKAIDIKQIGRELGVRYVVEGSVRKADGRIRVTAQLIVAESGRHVWAERYDRKLDDIFALQDEITLSIVAAIEPSLRMAELERVKRKRSDSLDAYDLVLQAQPDANSAMPEAATKALLLLDRALTLEPNYALAHAYAALCHHNLFLRAGLHEEERTASVRHAQAAIACGQDDALALSLAGFCIALDGHDRPAAFAAFDGALAVSPSSALTYIAGGVVYGWAGNSERAIDWAQRGMRLSPFDPWLYGVYHGLTLGHFNLGHYEEAADAARRAVQANPGFSISHMLLVAPLAKLGRLDEAKAAATRVLELQPNFRFSRQFFGVDCEPALAASMSDALRLAGLPE
jgi:TolB-like protein